MMDPTTYEQLTVDASIFGRQKKWLTDGMEVFMSVLPDGQIILGKFLTHFSSRAILHWHQLLHSKFPA